MVYLTVLVSGSDYIMSNDGIIVNNELERLLEEVSYGLI
jgi:hypothetical protein